MSQNLNAAAVEEYLTNLATEDLEALLVKVAGNLAEKEREATNANQDELEELREKLTRKETERHDLFYAENLSARETDLASVEYDRLGLEIVELEEQIRRLTRS